MLKKITKRQITLLGMLYISSLTYLQTFSPMANVARQHAAISFILSGGLCVLSLWLLSAAQGRFPDKNLMQAIVERFPVSGRVLLAMYLLFFLFIAARDIRILADFTNSVLLNRTPILILGLMITATAVYISQGGIRAFLGISEIYVPIMIAILTIVSIAMLRNIHIKYMIPYFSFDWLGIAKGAWYAAPYLGEIIALPLVISGKSYRVSAGLAGLITTALFLLGILLLTELVMGVPLTGKLTHSGYELIRQLQITDFMDRFDLLVVGLWYPTALGKIGFDIYVLCYLMQMVVPKLSGRLMTAPAGALAFVCSIWFFKNALQQFNFNYVWPLVALIYELVLPIVLFAALWPRKVKPKSG
ncbi:endospore germination permease [Paenibacillus macerans]|uniref:GerAB/ArcD/ProY family transporter n=1 Tax=Paenibacillus macerans TaxID=44252 RepID=UPI002E220542|nr:endospore germination permease [Paenibacillus macerans]